jgi:hypothetical protein
MYKATVAGMWGQKLIDGIMGSYPQFTIDYPHSIGEQVENVVQPGVNVPPDPNINMWVVTCELATLNAIEADPNYYVHSSQEIEGDLSDKPINGMPEAAEYGLMRAYYAQLKNADNTPALTPQEITDILGSPNEYSRGQILRRDENGQNKGAVPWCAGLKKAP